MVWLGLAWFGLVWFGLAWLGLVWFGLIRFGVVRFRSIWLGLFRLALALLLDLPKVAYDRLAAGVEAHKLAEVVARDGDHALVLGLEQLDQLKHSNKKHTHTQLSLIHI